MKTRSKKVRVIIPTTGRWAEIVYLASEAPEVGQSIVCVGGTTTQAGIDRGYDSFVRRPTGIIEKLFGHGTFRMDVGAPVDVGSSWQLATLVAHAVQAQGRLLQSLEEPDDREDLLVWATGAVRSIDLAVGEVGHVAEKAEHALSLFQEVRARGTECLMLVPAGNRDDISPAVRSEIEKLGVRIATPGDGYEAMQLVGATPVLQMAADMEVPEPPKWQGNPYPGLRAFTQVEAGIFHGRGRAREEGLERLRRNAAHGRAFLLVHGRSGAGKSSFAMAGIANDVVNRVHEGGQWQVATVDFVSARGDPLAAVADSIATTFALTKSERDEFAFSFARDGVPATKAILERSGTHQSSLLLVLDQFEQAFIQTDDTEKLKGFGRMVAQLAKSGFVWIVATMRTDQLELLETSSDLSRLITDERLYKLAPPSLYELTEIITQPALASGLAFETPELADRLAEIALRSPDSLPILQFVLSRMADLVGSDRVLSQDIYDRIGGFEGAIVKCAEDAVDRLEAQGIDQQEIARSLSELVRADQNGEHAVAREVPRGSDNKPRTRILDHLTDARLLVSVLRDGASHVRLAHEALIRNWPRLRKIVEDAGEALHLRDRLDAAARDWANSEKDAGLLLRGEGRTSAAEELLASGLLPIDDKTATYIKTSREVFRHEEAEREQAQRERVEAAREKEKLARRVYGRTIIGATAAAVFALASVGAGAWAYTQHKLARQSESLGLARLALDRAETQPMSALVLALAADAIDSGPEAQSRVVVNHAIATALAQPRTATIIPNLAEGTAFAVSPSGNTMLTTSNDGAQLWDLDRGTLLNSYARGKRIVSVGFGADDTDLVTISEEGIVKRWHTQDAGAPQDEFAIPRLDTLEYGVGRTGGEATPERGPQLDRALAGNADVTFLAPVAEDENAPVIPAEPVITPHLYFAVADEGRRVFVFMDNYAEAWNVETGKLINSSDGFYPFSEYGVKVSDDGRFVVDGSGLAWDVDTGRLVDLTLSGEVTLGHLALGGHILNVLRRNAVVGNSGDVERIDLQQASEPDHLVLDAIWPFETAAPLDFAMNEDGAFAILFSNGRMASGKAGDWSTIRTTDLFPQAEAVRPLTGGQRVVVRLPGELRVVDMSPEASMRPAHDLEDKLSGKWPLALAPDEGLALVELRGGELSLYDLVQEQDVLALPIKAQSLLDRPQFSVDGERLTLLFTGEDGAVQVAIYARSGDRWALETRTMITADPPSGQWLLSDGGRYIVEHVTLDHERSPLEGITVPVQQLPSEAIIRTADAPTEIVTRYELSAERGENAVLGISPDGSLLALAGSFGGTRFVHLPSGEGADLSRFLDRVHYSPDGTFMFAIRDHELSILEAETMIEVGNTSMVYDPVAGTAYRQGASPVIFASGTGRVLAVGGPDPENQSRIRLMIWAPSFFTNGFRDRACAFLPFVEGEQLVATAVSRNDLEGLRISSDELCGTEPP